jgi:hypothetical protein
MTIEDITYYIEKDMEEGFYGADCDLREMAHIEVLELLKELKAHREAWEKVLDEMMNASIPGQDAEYVYENIYDIIKKYRPKEGDAE